MRHFADLVVERIEVTRTWRAVSLSQRAGVFHSPRPGGRIVGRSWYPSDFVEPAHARMTAARMWWDEGSHVLRARRHASIQQK
jgi:hypothetical protein